MRNLYNQWLDSGKQTVTAAGNVRAPSKVDICDMVSEAWSTIPEEMISKSFVCCGQAKDGTPEEISCLKEGKVAAPALEKVKTFWNFTHEQFGNVQNHETIEIDDDQDVVISESDDD